MRKILEHLPSFLAGLLRYVRHLERTVSVRILPVLIVLVALLGLFSYGGYQYQMLRNTSAETEKELSGVIEGLQAHLASTTAENQDLLTLLNARTADFQNEIGAVTQKVATLEKLQSIDPQLLQKYSKVYFLNENYFPTEISLVDTELLFNAAKPVQIHSRVKGRLEAMVRDARILGLDISVLSGYRSFGTQASLKSQYTVTYGAGTSNAFSADQGYSEHQLGTTVDFGTKKYNGLTSFDKTNTYQWLLDNAYRYGFVLSYPKQNGYYIFEPWHWRYAGIELATYLHDHNLHFYDMPQRNIDAYLIKLFD